MPGSGTTVELAATPLKLGAFVPSLSSLREPEAAPLVKTTLAPAPMLNEASVWLTLPNLRGLPGLVTLTAEVPVWRWACCCPA